MVLTAILKLPISVLTVSVLTDPLSALKVPLRTVAADRFATCAPTILALLTNAALALSVLTQARDVDMFAPNSVLTFALLARRVSVRTSVVVIMSVKLTLIVLAEMRLAWITGVDRLVVATTGPVRVTPPVMELIAAVHNDAVEALTCPGRVRSPELLS